MEYNSFEEIKKPKLISEDILRIAKKVGIAFLILTILFSIIGAYFYTTQREIIDEAVASAMENFSGFVTEDGGISTVGLIINNIRVCFMAVALGVIPFLKLSALLIPINAAIISVIMVAIAGTNITHHIAMFVLGILPHGIFELPSIFLAIGSGIWLSTVLSRKILRKDPELNLGNEVINVLKVLFLVCIPLMVLAGIIETTITPALITRFFLSLGV